MTSCHMQHVCKSRLIVFFLVKFIECSHFLQIGVGFGTELKIDFLIVRILSVKKLENSLETLVELSSRANITGALATVVSLLFQILFGKERDDYVGSF